MKTDNSETVRIYYADGRISPFNDQRLAYTTWLSFVRGTRAAFRDKGDSRPVYAWDYTDKP